MKLGGWGRTIWARRYIFEIGTHAIILICRWIERFASEAHLLFENQGQRIESRRIFDVIKSEERLVPLLGNFIFTGSLFINRTLVLFSLVSSPPRDKRARAFGKSPRD